MQAVRRARITRAFALLLLASTSLAQPARAQAPDTSLWVTDGVVVSMLRVGNTLYMGGSFSRVGPHTGSGVPFDAGIGQPH